ncbi:MAG TPA: YmaF family protein [Clostridia bacterium]|nr:YmaF family protein [Clostridia bacterium]
MNSHIHRYKFESKTLCEHKHRLVGHTEGTIGINIFHIHSFYGISSYNGHTHYFSGFTGLPIKTQNGHVHKIEGVLEQNNRHEHEFSSLTFEEIAYYKDTAPREALV